MALPDEIISLKNLKTIRVQNSYLKKLPLTLLQMPSLVNMEFANNQLTSFYDELDVRRDQIDLPLLTYISLNGNQLTRIPTVLKNLPNLQQLHLHINKITDVKELCR